MYKVYKATYFFCLHCHNNVSWFGVLVFQVVYWFWCCCLECWLDLVSHSNQRLYNSDMCCFSAKYTVYRSKRKDWLRIRIMCLSGVTCLHVSSCIC